MILFLVTIPSLIQDFSDVYISSTVNCHNRQHTHTLLVHYLYYLWQLSRKHVSYLHRNLFQESWRCVLVYVLRQAVQLKYCLSARLHSSLIPLKYTPHCQQPIASVMNNNNTVFQKESTSYR